MVQMTFTFVYLILAVVTIPFVDNAPSNAVRRDLTEEDFRSRVFFVDRDSDDANNNNSPIIADAVLPPPLNEMKKKSLPTSKTLAKSAQSDLSLEVKIPKSSGVRIMDDERRIWGIAVENTDLQEDESYYNRPIVIPKNIVKIPTPSKKQPVSKFSEIVTPVFIPKPSECDTSIVICCQNPSKLKECFRSRGCINATEDMFPDLCSKESINRIIEHFGKYYKGKQE